MIAVALEFIHARKWLVELILLALIAGAIWWLCAHLVDVGVQRQKDADAAQLEKQRVADQAKADKAEHTHDEELISLRNYRDSHPFSYRVCIQPTGVPKPRPADGSDGAAAPAAVVGDRVPEADPYIAEDRGPLLDAFAALFDSKNAALRQWQNR